MIRYTAKDIVKRAEQLADLQNSDFIGDDEKNFLLNEAWTGIYQKAIEANSRQWIKTIEITNGARLPNDLYQIASVYEKVSHEPLTKGYPGYEITNKKIKIYNNSMRGYVLEYYPVPDTLFYVSDEKIKVSPSTNPQIYIDDDNYVDTNNNVYVNGKNFSKITSKSGYLFLFRNGYISIKYNSHEYINTYFYSYDNEDVSISKQIGSPYLVCGDTISFDKIVGNYKENCCFMMTDSCKHVLYQICFDETDNDIKCYDINGNKIYTFDINESLHYRLYCRDDGLYVFYGNDLSIGSIHRIRGDVVEEFPLGFYKACSFIDDTHMLVALENTAQSNEYTFYKTGFGPDSELNYPNNIYYTLLAYTMAVSFKMKQNGDTSQLEKKLDEAYQKLYSTITNDSNSVYTIKNVYGRSSIWL